MGAAHGERPRAKAPQKRKSQQQSHPGLLNIEENDASSAAAGSSTGARTGSVIEASSSEQRLQAVNVTKPVVPLKSIQFLQLNGRSSRGLHGRSPGEEGNIEGSTSKERDHGAGNASKFTMQQQLMRGDQQLKERQRLINQ